MEASHDHGGYDHHISTMMGVNAIIVKLDDCIVLVIRRAIVLLYIKSRNGVVINFWQTQISQRAQEFESIWAWLVQCSLFSGQIMS